MDQQHFLCPANWANRYLLSMQKTSSDLDSLTMEVEEEIQKDAKHVNLSIVTCSIFHSIMWSSVQTRDFPMLKRIFIPSPMGMAEKQLSVKVFFIADIQIPLEITAAEA